MFISRSIVVAALILVAVSAQATDEGSKSKTRVELNEYNSFDPTALNFDSVSLPGIAGLVLVLALWWGFYTDRLRMPVKIAKLKKDLGYFLHLDEIYYMFVFKFTKTLPQIPTGISSDMRYCYDKLQQTSRSFSAVILELHPELRDSVCIFYLVLRGLDSIEDDMGPPVEEKIDHLHKFYLHLNDREWNMADLERIYGTNDRERDLLKQFNRVTSAHLELKEGYRVVIEDICKKMGYGMAEYLTKDVKTIADYEKYCHYVAGLVGHGLSGLFAASGLEDPRIDELKDLSNSMGLFLQKTNISRDYLEDVLEVPPRVFYPEEIWSLYSGAVGDFKEWKNNAKALKLINHMVTDALKHAEASLDYMKMIQEPSVFKFCAIPQVMAIATLNVCYNNIDVFRWEVKIRKGEAVKLILACDNFESVCKLFLVYVQKLRAKIPSGDPNAQQTRRVLEDIEAKIHRELRAKKD